VIVDPLLLTTVLPEQPINLEKFDGPGLPEKFLEQGAKLLYFSLSFKRQVREVIGDSLLFAARCCYLFNLCSFPSGRHSGRREFGARGVESTYALTLQEGRVAVSFGLRRASGRRF
jgi:hypothetical protein